MQPPAPLRPILAVSGCSLGLLTGCPQLLDDDFGSLQSLARNGTEHAGTGSGSSGMGGMRAEGGTGGGSTLAGTGGSVSPGGTGGSAGGTGGEGNAEPDAEAPAALCAGEFGSPTELSIAGVSDALYGAWPFGERLFFSSFDGNAEDIYVATWLGNDSYGSTLLLNNVNGSDLDGGPSLTPDGLELFFFSDRAGGDGGGRDLWRATRTTLGTDFGLPQPIANVGSSSLEGAPRLSADGTRLRFVSARAGNSDLWEARRETTDDEFEAPTAFDELNTSDREEGAAYSVDDLTVYFSSDRTTSSMDVWRATRSSRDEPFGNVERIPALSSGSDDTDLALTLDGTEIFFSSARSGNMAIWHAFWVCD